MKKINFLGAYDKTDCILYVAKILTILGKKVLVVDNTINQKARYVVPVITPTVSYVTEFEDIDVAIGFDKIESIKNYLGITDERDFEYDYVLCDIDNEKGIESFNVRPDENNYFVTGFDIYTLKRGLEIFNNIKEPLNLTKVLYAKEMLKEEDDYLNFLSRGLKITWKNDSVYFPIENGDGTILAENQRLAKIKFKQLSVQCKEGFIFLAEDILKDVNDSTIRKALRMYEK